MRRRGPLLDKYIEANEKTVVAMQRRGRHASTMMELLLETVLCNPMLGSCNSKPTTMETEVFSM
jgi:hypothetical protein